MGFRPEDVFSQRNAPIHVPKYRSSALVALVAQEEQTRTVLLLPLFTELLDVSLMFGRVDH